MAVVSFILTSSLSIPFCTELPSESQRLCFNGDHITLQALRRLMPFVSDLCSSMSRLPLDKKVS